MYTQCAHRWWNYSRCTMNCVQCFMEPLKEVQVEGRLMFAEPHDLFGNLDEVSSVRICCLQGRLIPPIPTLTTTATPPQDYWVCLWYSTELYLPFDMELKCSIMGTSLRFFTKVCLPDSHRWSHTSHDFVSVRKTVTRGNILWELFPSLEHKVEVKISLPYHVNCLVW